MEIMTTAHADLLTNAISLPGSNVRDTEFRSSERKPFLAPLTTQSADPGPDVSIVALEIGGMSCTACGTALEKSLMRLKGVEGVSVAFITNKAQVTYHHSVIQVHCALTLNLSKS